MSKPVTGRISEEEKRAVEAWVESGKFKSRSQLVGAAVSQYLEQLGDPPDVDVPEKAEPKSVPDDPSDDPGRDRDSSRGDGDPPSESDDEPSLWNRKLF